MCEPSDKLGDPLAPFGFSRAGKSEDVSNALEHISGLERELNDQLGAHNVVDHDRAIAQYQATTLENEVETKHIKLSIEVRYVFSCVGLFMWQVAPITALEFYASSTFSSASHHHTSIISILRPGKAVGLHFGELLRRERFTGLTGNYVLFNIIVCFYTRGDEECIF